MNAKRKRVEKATGELNYPWICLHFIECFLLADFTWFFVWVLEDFWSREVEFWSLTAGDSPRRGFTCDSVCFFFFFSFKFNATCEKFLWTWSMWTFFLQGSYFLRCWWPEYTATSGDSCSFSNLLCLLFVVKILSSLFGLVFALVLLIHFDLCLVVVFEFWKFFLCWHLFYLGLIFVYDSQQKWNCGYCLSRSQTSMKGGFFVSFSKNLWL